MTFANKKFLKNNLNVFSLFYSIPSQRRASRARKGGGVPPPFPSTLPPPFLRFPNFNNILNTFCKK